MWSGICMHVAVRGQLPALSKGPLLAVLPSWLTHRLPESLRFLLSISDSGVLGLWMLTLRIPDSGSHLYGKHFPELRKDSSDSAEAV